MFFRTKLNSLVLSFAIVYRNLSSTMLSYLEPHSLIFTQAAIQLVCWHYIFEYFMWYMATYMTKKRWFIQASRKPVPGVGALGEEALIQMLSPMIQHVFGGALIAVGYFTNSPQLFITGALSEFAYEILDTVWTARSIPFQSSNLYRHSVLLFVLSSKSFNNGISQKKGGTLKPLRRW